MPPTSEMEHPVLLIEADGDLAALYSRALEATGLRVTREASATSALGLLRDVSVSAVVASDSLPEIRAEDLCRTIRQYPGWELLPLFVASAVGDVAPPLLLHAGADAVFDSRSPELLAAHVRRAVERSAREASLRATLCNRALERAARTLAVHLNSPASFISMCVQMLVEPCAADSEVRLLGHKIEHQLARIRGLVPRLRAAQCGVPDFSDGDVFRLPEEPPKVARTARIRTLIVDDEADVRSAIRISLEQTGQFEVFDAVDGKIGLERAIKEKPDLVLLDLAMPVLDGAEACRRMRTHPALQTTAIVILTATSTAEQMVRLFELGASGFLVKPFQVRALPEQLQTILERQL